MAPLMLDAMARHGHISLKINATGDLEIDPHHTMEDIGLALGQAQIGRAHV